MRCLNCQIVLMPGDRRCPACGAYTNTAEAGTLQAQAEFDPAARRQLVQCGREQASGDLSVEA